MSTLAVDPTTPPAVKPARKSFGARELVSRYGVLVAIVLTFLIFSLLRPDSFLTRLTLLGILRDCVPLLMVALGVTVVMVMNQFDLSVGGLTSLLAVFVVVALSSEYWGFNYWVAILLTLALGAALGSLSGIAVAYLRLPAFILTIALSTVYAGVGLQLTDSNSVFSGIPSGFVDIASGTLFGISNQVYIGAVVLALLHVLMRHTEPGRYMYAIGGNVEAARLAGVRVRVLIASGFAIVGLTAAISAILLSSQAGASNPNAGLGQLLPAYAAAFLGSSLFRVGVFTPVGTAIGALYLQMIGSGLTLLNLSGPMVSIIQGGILVAAIGISRLARGSR